MSYVLGRVTMTTEGQPVTSVDFSEVEVEPIVASPGFTAPTMMNLSTPSSGPGAASGTVAKSDVGMYLGLAAVAGLIGVLVYGRRKK